MDLEAPIKNILVFDGGLGCTFPVFQATDEEFVAIFAMAGQDIELAEDFCERVGEQRANEVLGPIGMRPIQKRDAKGIQGILLYNSEDRRPYLPASRREVDWDERSLNTAQREMNRRLRGA